MDDLRRCRMEAMGRNKNRARQLRDQDQRIITWEVKLTFLVVAFVARIIWEGGFSNKPNMYLRLKRTGLIGSCVILQRRRLVIERCRQEVVLVSIPITSRCRHRDHTVITRYE